MRNLIFACLLLLIATGLGCRKKGGVDPLQVRLAELQGTWTVERVVNDNQNVTSLYALFSLTIDGDLFQTGSGGNAWPASGSFTINRNDIDTIIRNDGVEVSIEEINANRLQLSFDKPNVSSREQGITGNFIFNLIKS